MTIAVIIVSWNVKDLLADCLHSLQADLLAAGVEKETEVWVIDNASTDGSVAMIRQQFNWVRLIANEQNIGFAPANNQAIRQSTGDYVLLLNPDTVIKPPVLRQLLDFLEANPAIGAVGPRILNADETLQISCYPAPTLSRELWRLFHLDALWPYGSYQMAKWPLDKPRQVESLLGACILMRRQALAEVGLFDEGYFMFSEEIDLCYRLRQAGWPLYWLPDAQVIHLGGQSTKQVAAAMFLQLYQGKLRYFRKNRGNLAGGVYKLILLAASLMRLALNPIATLLRPQQRENYKVLSKHYWQLLQALPGW